MPRINWHVAKKKNDLDASNIISLHSTNHLDWEIITLFYSVLHHVDSVFCERRSTGLTIPEPKDHKERRKLVVRHLTQIADDYKVLDALSQWARYEEVQITPQILTEAKNCYSSIVSFLQRYVP